MLQTEFERLTDRPFTEEEFWKIHFVYCYYPGVNTHADIALIWQIGGIQLIDDMTPTAKTFQKAEQELKIAKDLYQEAKERYQKMCLL